MTTIVLQEPAEPIALVLMFHGVGALPQTMVPLGKSIAQAHPQAAVVSVASPHPSDLGGGYQWFSVKGISEESRPLRVEQAMPDFIACVQTWQSRFKLAPANTTLLGFSQGAIMALEATQQPVRLAKRVLSLAGRFCKVPQVQPWAAVHLVHGTQDRVIPSTFSESALEALISLGAKASLASISDLGHSLESEVIREVLVLLSED